jgi:thiamine-phosphate pyrophosphorylase
MDEKPCGLIAIVPPALEAGWAAGLPEFIGEFKPAALIVQASAAELIEAAKAFELAVLFTDGVDAARRMGASGVYLTTPEAEVAAARKALGATAIIGAACGLSRHAAMESAEAGADFIAFDASSPESLGKAAELSLWWDEITGVPAALLFAKARPGRSMIAKARADFVILEESERPGESLTFATELGLQSQS